MRARIVEVNQDAVITEWSEAVAERLNIPAQDAEGKTIQELLGEAHALDFDRLKKSGGSCVVGTIRAEARGELLQGETLWVALYGEDGAFNGALLILQLAQEGPDAKEIAGLRAWQAQSGFTARFAAHEVRNAIGILMGTLQLVREQGTEHPNTGERLNHLEHVTERIRDSVYRLIHLGTGEEESKPELHALNEVVHEVVMLCGETLQRKGIQCRVELDPDLPEVPLLYRSISELLFELVINAQNALPGGGEIVIRTLSAEGGVQLWVRDNGAGIREAEREKIFEPFYTTKKTGTGLGLAAVRRIVLEHGGSIGIESSPAGTVFKIRLPRSQG